MERLDKIISNLTDYSRKEVKLLVKKGFVTIDGVPAVAPDQKVEDASVVAIDGEEVVRKRRVVALLNKPSGYVTSTEDPLSPTVMELVPEALMRMEIYPVGRLDKETEGLLVFTNDGTLAHHLISPKHEIRKVYYAEHEGTATEEDVEAFRHGLVLEADLTTKPALLEPLGEGKSRITVTEGKYHQVRRMMASRGLHVLYLERIQEGRLTLEGLERGRMRELTEEDERLLAEN